LGYIVDEHGVHVDPAKIQVIRDWPAPTTLTELWSFLGLANFYRRFVLGFSHIAWALSQVTKGSGKEKFAWGQAQQQAFDDLKHHLCSTPLLSLPDLQQPFDIETDASDYVVGAVLTQHGHPVAYHSETLSDIVRKYPTYDKEMYSIVKSCRQWKHYILGKETIITLITSLCSSYRHRGSCRTTAIKSGPHTYNSSISTSSIKHGAQIMSLTSLVALSLLHSPQCSILMGMRHLSGPNFISVTLTLPPPISSWVQE
jgi:hypothetical protein